LKIDQLPPQRFEKRLAEVPELLFQPLGAIAIAARPWLGAILIFAAPAIVRILNSRQFEILFPIGPLFEKRCRAVANLHPARCLILAEPRLSHIPQVLAFRYRPFAESPVLDGFEKLSLLPCLYSRPYQIPHILLPLSRLVGQVENLRAGWQPAPSRRAWLLDFISTRQQVRPQAAPD
jgi:hypothetical protein